MNNHTTEMAEQSLNCTVSIGEGLPPLSKKLLQRIQTNDYIDFFELPPAKDKLRPMLHQMEGRVLLVQLQELESHCRPIPDFATWAQCFAIYAAAILHKQPHRAPDLMAYMVETANNAKKYSWPS